MCYDKLKVNKDGIKCDENTIRYFVISAEWVNLWKLFIQKKSGIPPKIRNKPLY